MLSSCVVAMVYVLPCESEQLTVGLFSEEIAATMKLPAVLELLKACAMLAALASLVVAAPCTKIIGTLLTVTGMGALVALLPAASRATAVKVCAPFATVRVFHEME